MLRPAAGLRVRRDLPGCRLLDIHEYLLEKGVQLDGVTGVRYMYHDPCHTPMKTHEPLQVVNALHGQERPRREERPLLRRVGHVRVTRPDIATQVRFRKEQEMRKARRAARRRLRGRGQGADVVPVVPAGPVALRRRRGIDADYIVVEMARHVLGPNWLPDYVRAANNGGIERVLV